MLTLRCDTTYCRISEAIAKHEVHFQCEFQCKCVDKRKIQGNFEQSPLFKQWRWPVHDRALKVIWLIDYLNEHFLSSMEPEVEQSVDEHMIKYKGRSIMRQHIKNKPIKWGFRIRYRCTPKTSLLYDFNIYTGRKETTEFGLSESVVIHLTES